MSQAIIDNIYIVKKTLDDLSILLNLNVHSDTYVHFLEMHSLLNDIIAKTKYNMSNQELLDSYINDLVTQGKDPRLALKNGEYIIPLLRIISLENKNTIRYNNANKALISLTTPPPSFWKKYLN